MLREILQPNRPIDRQKLYAFEFRYKTNLPISYRDFLLNTNGGQPIPAAFPIQGFPQNPKGVIQAFFGLSADISTEDLETIMNDLEGRIPNGILPVACTDGDDFVIIDLRKNQEPVLFWDRKPFWGNNVWNNNNLYPIATDFQTFLEKLHDL